MVPHGSTKARVLHWFVRGGKVKTPDGNSFPIDVDPLVVGRDPGAQIVVDDRGQRAPLRALARPNTGSSCGTSTSTNGTFIGSTRVREAVVTMPTTVLVGGDAPDRRAGDEAAGRRRLRRSLRPARRARPRRCAASSACSRRWRRRRSACSSWARRGPARSSRRAPCTRRAPRAAKPFVVVDCGSIPPTLAESLLFGHEKGAFTGAHGAAQGGARRGPRGDALPRRARRAAARPAAEAPPRPAGAAREAGRRRRASSRWTSASSPRPGETSAPR